MNKSLAIIYIGIKNEEKDKIGKKNHEILFNLLEKNNIKYKIYDFTFNEPFHEKTNISQIKNFFHALKNTNENLIIKLRYDILIYENSFEILLNTIIDFINQKNYGYFIGGSCKTYMENKFTYIDSSIETKWYRDGFNAKLKLENKNIAWNFIYKDARNKITWTLTWKQDYNGDVEDLSLDISNLMFGTS